MGFYDINGNGVSDAETTETMALGAAVLLDRPIPRKLSWELPWTDDYLQQGVCVAGDYIVSAWNPHRGAYADKRNKVYFIDKNTMELATLKDSDNNDVANPIILDYSSSTQPTKSHANSLTYVPFENAVYINSMFEAKCYAIELDDFTVSTKTLPRKSTAFAFDPVTLQWCYVTYSGNNYSIYIYAQNNSTLVRTITPAFHNSQQGVMFHNGLIYLVKSEFETDDPYTDNDIFALRQLILIYDSYGNLLKTWWFGSRGFDKIEFEDIDFVEDGKIVIGVNFNNAWGQLYAMQIKPENNSPQLTENDTFSIIQLDQRTDFMTSVKGVDLDTLTYDGRYYFVEDA